MHNLGANAMSRFPPPVTYVPCRRRAQWAMGFMLVLILLAAVAIVSGEMQAGLLDRFARVADGTEPYDKQAIAAEAESNDLRQQVIGISQTALAVVMIVFFLRWVHRAHKNLRPLGAQGLEFTPGWAVGWFFVPFLCLYKPHQVMCEIWAASDPMYMTLQRVNWRRLSGAAFVGLWWAAWLLCQITGLITRQLSRHSDDGIPSLIGLTRLDQFHDLTIIAMMVTTVILIRTITRRQEQKWAAVQALAAEPIVTAEEVAPDAAV